MKDTQSRLTCYDVLDNRLAVFKLNGLLFISTSSFRDKEDCYSHRLYCDNHADDLSSESKDTLHFDDRKY